MTTLLHNIDDVRAEIMRLENEHIFVQAGWDRVLLALTEQGRTAALADCRRRMMTAMMTALQNADLLGGDAGRRIDGDGALEQAIVINLRAEIAGSIRC